MYNKKLLLTALKNLDKAKKPAKKKDIDYNSKMGYRKDSPFRKKASMDIYTENGTIDMSETDRDILANGRVLPAYSGMHQFNTNVVNETPLEEARYGRSGNLNATNRLLVKNPLLKKNKLFKDNPLYKKKSYKRKIYDPSAMYFQDGGSSDNDSSKSIVAKPSWYQEPIVNPAAYVSGFRGGNPNMYKYGFLTTDRGNIVGGGGLGFPKSGIELTGLGVVPTSSDERQYFKGFYDAKISKDINKNINLGLGAGAAITGYPGDNGFVMDPIQLQPNVSLKYKFEDGGPIELELTPEEIDEYRKGGYIVEEVNDPSIPKLNRFDNGGSPKSQWIAPADMYSGRSNVDPTTGLIYKDLGDLDVKAGKKGFKRKVQDFFRKDIGKLTKEAEELGKGVGYIAGVQGDIEPAVYNREGIKKFKSEVKRLKGDFNTELKDAEKKRKQESDNKSDYDKWKKKLDDGDISASEFLLKGKGKNWEAYNDVKVAKGTGSDADYSATAARKEWGDSDQWDKFTGLVSNAATAIPLLGAAGAMGSAGAALLQNPVVQGGLTAYGAYDATTNTLPEAYKDFKEGRYWEGLGNTALGALDFVPGVGLASKGAKLGYKGLGKAINYAKNLEPAAPGPMMLMGRFADDVAKTGDDVAKVVTKAETPKSNFKSEIDWDKWNPEISKNPELLQEYNAIEEAAKADGTWMKNPDGSPFVLPDGKAGQHWTFTKGTPEQFVQMQSQNFKKAYPEGFDAWYTGRMKDPTEQFPLFAELYPEGRSIFGGDYHVATRYASTQPEGYDTFKRITTEFKPKEITKFTDADQTAKAHGLISPKTSNSFLFNARKQGWREIPVGSDTGITPMWEGQPIENFRESLKTTFKNPKTGIDETGYKVKSDDIAEHLEKNNMDYATIEDVVDGSVADYVRIHNLKSGNYPKSLWGNNGMFDLSNPNIYKAIIPTVGVAGTATMLANPFQGSDGLQQQQYGGALSKFIGGGSPCDDGYTYDPKLGCIPLSEESMTEAQQWMTNWYKNRTIEFPEDQKGFKKANEKVLPAYNPESPMFKQMESFPVYEPIPEEYMEKDPGGYPPAGMYDGEGKVPTIYFSPDLNDEQKTDTEIHELTNHFMRRSKELYPMYDKIVKENIIPFDKTWPKEKKEFYDYIINPEEQNIQSYLNVARKKFNLKPDEVVTPERLNKMREEAKKKGLLEEGGKNFNPDIFLLFRTAKDDESLMRLFNLIAKNDSNKDEIQYGQYGGTLELGDEIELTKEQVAELKKYGYTLEQI